MKVVGDFPPACPKNGIQTVHRIEDTSPTEVKTVHRQFFILNVPILTISCYNINETSK